MQITDQMICSLLSAGEERGMEYLFEKYYKPLVVWSAGFMNNVMHAEDVVQTFFIKIWERRKEQVLQAQTLKSFLYTSVRNLSLDRLEKKDPLRNASDICDFDRKWEEYDTGEEEMLARISKEVAALPERSRTVMECVYRLPPAWAYRSLPSIPSWSTPSSAFVKIVPASRQNYSFFCGQGKKNERKHLLQHILFQHTSPFPIDFLKKNRQSIQ